MKTDNREAVMLLALDALVFADQVSPDWPEEKQLRHLREQIAMARKHLESDPAEAMKQVKAEVERLHAERDQALASQEAAIKSWTTCSNERNQLKAQINGMKQAIDDLVRNSEGVAGLHQNGDVAPWNDLLAGGRFEEWLSVFDEVQP